MSKSSKLLICVLAICSISGWGWGSIVFQEKNTAQRRVSELESRMSGYDPKREYNLESSLSSVCLELKIFRAEVGRIMTERHPDRYPDLDLDTIGRAYMKNKTRILRNYDACASR